MKLLGRKNGDGDTNPADEPGSESTVSDIADAETVEAAKTTPPKGRPTPKRDEGRRRGPVAPAPMTTAEARKRRKEMAGPKLPKAERKAARLERRAKLNENRERMMAGEEAYLLPRDKGPVRRYVRDLVDSRYNVLGLFMPIALIMIFSMLAAPQVQAFISPAMLLLMAALAVDAVILSRRVNRAVDEKFPDNTESNWRLGFYAAGRASQLRRMRAPKPQVNRGDKIS
ncbi:DUF3043 domain-containing protein [[Mycobacterium] wendilense]|uniref:DUF3043 domain-containing protein n=1 Tax=[Mycobacterium] wendilense TaxID=3064284 RepID=UPI0037CCA472